MADGVISATVTEGEKHPWIIAGAVAGLALLIWLMSGSKTTAPTTFTYSSGPSDAQVAASTALEAQQSQNSAQASIAGQYFQYLSTASANGLQADQIASNTALGTAGYAVQQAIGTAQIAAQTTQAANVLSAQTQQVVAGDQMQTTLGVAATNANSAVAQAGLAAQTQQWASSIDLAKTQTNDFTAGVLATINKQ